jgi:hypothetical protein
MSAHAPKAELQATECNVAVVPIAAVCSFDHLVGATEQREWHSEAECLGCFEVDDEFDFHQLLNRQFRRLFALRLISVRFGP